jgi:hypothetical protein
VEERPEPLDRRLAVDTGTHARDDATVLHRVPRAGWCLRAVGDRDPAARRVTREVRGRQDELAGGGQSQPVDRAQEPRVREHDLGWQQRVREPPARAVQVDQDLVEHLCPLDQSSVERRPLELVDDHRDGVEVPARCARSRVVGAVRDAVVGEQQVRLGSAPGELGPGERVRELIDRAGTRRGQQVRHAAPSGAGARAGWRASKGPPHHAGSRT